MTWDDIERLFMVAHPEGGIRRISIARRSGVLVRYGENSLAYKYTGTPAKVAKALKLDGIVDGDSLPKKDGDGCYKCLCRYRTGPLGVKEIVVRSPFTGESIAIKEGWKNEAPILWELITLTCLDAEREREAEGKILRQEPTLVPLYLEDLQKLKAVYDLQIDTLTNVRRTPV